MEKIVLYIDSLRRGGAQRVMSNIVDYFAAQNVEVILVNDINGADGYKVYDVAQNVRRYYLDQAGETSAFRLNFNRIHVLREILRKEKPDVVLSFLGGPNLRLLFATLGMKVKKVISVRNDPHFEYGSGIRFMIARLLFLRTDGIVFQTADAAKYFSKIIQKKSQVIPNPVNEKFYSVEPENNGNIDIVTVGRIQPQKNQLLLVNAFAEVARIFPDARLIIYGEGDLQSNLAFRVGELGLTDRVLFEGNVSDIEQRLRTATVFVLPSDFEGMPNALMEAMAVGVPVISTDCPCGGPRFLIENGKQGFLTECGNVQMLADALKKVLGNTHLQKQMRKAARERAEEFRQSIIMAKWAEYLKCIALENK